MIRRDAPSMTMLQLDNSSELTILISRMHTDLQVYCEAVDQLSHRDGHTTLDDLYERSERSRIAFEAARERLKMYTAKHDIP